jgi:hypothetical protein
LGGVHDHSLIVIFQHGRRLQPMSQIIDDGLQFVKHRRLPSLPVIWTRRRPQGSCHEASGH